jgi:osmotically-inducible protein OsmY
VSKQEDSDLRRRVIDELEWDPAIDATAIAVAVKEGVVTLTGTVANYSQKVNAERVVKRVFGVKAVAEELAVQLPYSAQRSDSDIAHSALSALRFNVAVPADRIKVIVAAGWITLEGEVDWQFQRAAAQSAVKYLQGVKGVVNGIRLTPHASSADVKQKIQSAFARRAQLDANRIMIDCVDGKVTLRGTVETWDERFQAEQAAWAAPGVTRVQDDLVVSVA